MKLIIFFLVFLTCLNLYVTAEKFKPNWENEFMQKEEYDKLYTTPLEKLNYLFDHLDTIIQEADSGKLRKIRQVKSKVEPYGENYENLFEKLSPSDKSIFIERLKTIVIKTNFAIDKAQAKSLATEIEYYFSNVLSDKKNGLPALKGYFDVSYLIGKIESALNSFNKSTTVSKVDIPSCLMTVGEAFAKLEIFLLSSAQNKDLVEEFRKVAHKALELDPNFPEFTSFLSVAYPEIMADLVQGEPNVDETINLIANLAKSKVKEENIEGKYLEKLVKDNIKKMVSRKDPKEKKRVNFNLVEQPPTEPSSKEIELKGILRKTKPNIIEPIGESSGTIASSSGASPASTSQKKLAFYQKLWFKITFAILAFLLLVGAIGGLFFWSCRSKSSCSKTKTNSSDKQQISDF